MNSKRNQARLKNNLPEEKLVLIIKTNGVRCIFYYRMYRVSDGVLVFEGETEHYFINPLGKLINVKRTNRPIIRS